LPFKLNQNRRRHIPRARRRVTNWPAYDASLRQRGSLTVWFTSSPPPSTWSCWRNPAGNTILPLAEIETR